MEKMATETRQFSISGTTPVGDCCHCELTDSEGKLVKHVDHYALYKCQNPDCGCWSCKEHLVNGLCYGCYCKNKMAEYTYSNSTTGVSYIQGANP